MNARITAIHEGLGGSSTQRSETELVIRLADGELSRLPALATSLVKDHVDAILAAGPPAVQASRDATADIPVIAIDLESDPVASGWIESLARPGGNVTGVFLDFPTFSAKCLQLLIEACPALAGIGVLWDPTTGPLQLGAVEIAARELGIDVQIFEARRVADIADAFYGLDLARVQGVLVLSSPLFGGNPQLVADLAPTQTYTNHLAFSRYRKRGWASRVWARHSGALSASGSYGAQGAAGCQTGRFARRTSGSVSADSNLKPRRSSALELPSMLLARADEMIE